MKNLIIKKQLLEKNKLKEYEEIRYKIYKNRSINIDKLSYTEKEDRKIDKSYYIRDFKDIKKYIKGITYKEYRSLEQLRQSKTKQRRELYKHLYYWQQRGYEILFCTYTLNDETLFKNGELNIENIYLNTKELQDKLTRILNKGCIDYIGNVDYGKNERLHYHVLQAHKKGSVKEYFVNNGYLAIETYCNIAWQKYGLSNSELVNYTKVNNKKVSSYLTKLTSHSIKLKSNRLFIKKNTEYKDLKNSVLALHDTLTEEKINNWIEKLEQLELTNKYFNTPEKEQTTINI